MKSFMKININMRICLKITSSFAKWHGQSCFSTWYLQKYVSIHVQKPFHALIKGSAKNLSSSACLSLNLPDVTCSSVSHLKMWLKHDNCLFLIFVINCLNFLQNNYSFCASMEFYCKITFWRPQEIVCLFTNSPRKCY